MDRELVAVSHFDAFFESDEEDEEEENVAQRIITTWRFRAAWCTFYLQWFLLTATPMLFMEHLHHCNEVVVEVLYSHATILLTIVLGVVSECAIIPRSLRISICPIVLTIVSKLNFYTDVLFACIAHDCHTSLWWASFAVLSAFMLTQMSLHIFLSMTDCDHQLPTAHGIIWFDLKILNAALFPLGPIPFAGFLVMEHVVVSVSQISIQAIFLEEERKRQAIVNPLVHCSIWFSVLHMLLLMCEFVWRVLYKPERDFRRFTPSALTTFCRAPDARERVVFR